MNVYVFISYSHAAEDAKAVKAFAGRLDRAGIDYFLDDRSILYGERIPASVEEALRSATHVVPFLSPGAESSQWVFFEIGIGYAMGKPIVLRLLHSHMKIPIFLANIKCITTVPQEREFIKQLHQAKKLSRGTLREVNRKFGHVDPEAGESLIFYERDLLSPRRLDELREGDMLEFERELGGRLRKAVQVRRVAPAPPSFGEQP